MSVLLGGRAAEFVVFAHYSTGAADDLQKVTDIGRSMVMRYGMVEKLGNVAYEGDRASFLGPGTGFQERNYSEETAREIDCAVREIVKSAFDRSVALLTERRELLERSARLLLEKETLGEEELAKIAATLAA